MFESFTIGKKVTYLGKYAFADCANLKTVVFEDGCPSIKQLQEGTFKNCTALTSVNLPTKLETTMDQDWNYYHAIDAYAFYNCTSLTSIDFSTITCYYSIGQYAFAHSGLKEVTITEYCMAADYNREQGMADLNQYAFAYCDNLTKVTFLVDGYYQFANAVFAYCENLEELNYPGDISYCWTTDYPFVDLFIGTPLEGVYY